MTTATKGPVNVLLKKFEFTRDNLINFSDAIFAIAITLLAIDIRLPEGLAGQSLLSALLGLWPNFLSYVISFVVIAVYWYNYHKIIYYAPEVDNKITDLNIVFLFFVTIMPFTASLLSRYGNESAAVVIYAASLALGNGVLFILWWYIQRKYLLSRKVLNKRYVGYLYTRTLFPVVLAFLSIVIALFNPLVAEIFLFLDPASIWLRRLFRIEE